MRNSCWTLCELRVRCKGIKSHVLTNKELEQCESDVELHWSKHLHKTRSVHSPVLETGQGPCLLADRKGFDRRSCNAFHNHISIYPILWRAIFGGRVFVSEFGEMLDLLLAAFLAFPCFSMTSPAFLSSHCFSVVAPAFLIFSAFVCLLRFSLFLCECFCLLFPLPLRLVCSSWLFSFTVPLVFVEAY